MDALSKIKNMTNLSEIKVPYLNTNPFKDIATHLYLVPIWWVLGATIFVYHIFSLWIFGKVLLISLKQHQPVRVPSTAIFILSIVFICGFSILINLPDSELDRVVASLNNLGYWVMGFFIITAIYNSFSEIFILNIINALNFNIVVIGILAVISIYAWNSGVREISFKTPLLMVFPVLGNFTLLEGSLTINLLGVDWFADFTWPRLTILSPFPTALGAFLIMSIPLTATYMSIRNRSRWLLLPILVAGCLSLILTLSRTSILALVVAMVFVYFCNSRKYYKVVLPIITASIMFLAYYFWASGLFDYLLELRAGSSSLRFDMYRYSLEYVFNESPFLGIGVKPRGEFIIPVGSHSAYIGMLVKSGLLGLLSLVALQIHILYMWISGVKYCNHNDDRKIWGGIGVSLISMSMWILTEDLDAPHLVAFVYFILVGTMVSFRKVLVERYHY